MGAKRDEIVQYLNEYLQIGKFRDYGPNGMQVIGRAEVRRIGLGVSANLACFRRASEQQADMLLVHHGLFWENMPREIGAMMKARLQLLFESDMSLLAYHLPLDAHPEKGNNVLWLQRLGCTVEGVTLGGSRGMPIGATGTAPAGLALFDMVDQIEQETGVKPLVYAYGPRIVQRLGVVTGGGQGYLLEAIVRGCDTFLTGEVGEPTQGVTQEEGINFIAAGHYNTEKIGVRALGMLLEEHFDVETFFCDVPNNV